MTPAEIRTAVKAILVDVLELLVEPEAIGDDDLLFNGELGLESVSCIEILVEIERVFGIRLYDEQIEPRLFRSVNTLAEAVEAHLR